MSRATLKRTTWSCVLLIFAGSAAAQQIEIPRVEQMPAFPSPYAMRDWRRVAQRYDSLVFDRSRQGTYLPFVWVSGTWFGMPSYVGSRRSGESEAINTLPAIIGATLSGIDKRDQFGVDWVSLAPMYYNADSAEQVYLNGAGASSGSDWWYDTMPNVFFYQLFDLYPDVPGFDAQFRSVADRWLTAVRAMSGSAAPWTSAEMDYRAWHLATMSPRLDGVHEPEAAGAIAWLLYNAFRETGDEQYRVGAEWAMEFLDTRTQNPSYELQLAYGAYTAARMNAELGTSYDVEQLVRWCFDVGPLRSWGAILGTWGGYDVDGLIGEVNGTNDYAFVMNTFEQVGALVPLVRYDDHFARAIGRWVLNAANAARLFYTAYLPDANQDSELWTHVYDFASVVAHEAIRETSYGQQPFATGDAVGGGWAETNLALYASSHVGILGGIVDTTDVSYILRLDARRTDYFGEGYPTYLYYNPYDTEQTVTLDAGEAPRDLYDAVRNDFVRTGVSGRVSITLPADGAALIVLAPAGGVQKRQDARLLVDGVPIDYDTGGALTQRVRIKGLAAAPSSVLRGGTASLFCTGDGEVLQYAWTAAAGLITGDGPQVQWTAPDEPGAYVVACSAVGASGSEDRAELIIQVVSSTPVIDSVRAEALKVDLGATTHLTCDAHDQAATDLKYVWRAAAGSVSGTGAAVDWTAPDTTGDFYITCRVSNGAGADAADSVRVAVRDFSAGGGTRVLWLPFDDGVADESGYDRGITVNGTRPAEDPFGHADRALHFSGTTDVLRVDNAPELNFSDGITVVFWLKVLAFYSREVYVASHGSWEQRWKLSVVDRRLRWTVHTSQGVFDLDSVTRLEPDQWYYVLARFDGRDVELYLGGVLDAIDAHAGSLLPSAVDLTIGQRFPGDTQYGLAGDLDAFALYDGALSANAIHTLYEDAVAMPVDVPEAVPEATALQPPFPNPFRTETTIRYELRASGSVQLRIIDLLGREVRTLVRADESAGHHEVHWDGTDTAGRPVAAGIYFCTLVAGSSRSHTTLVRIR